MADQSASETAARTTGVDRPYDPPRIETVLTAEQLEREVLYAGEPSREA